MKKETSVAVIGVGKLGEALITGLLNNAEFTDKMISGSVRKSNALNKLKETFNIELTLSNRELIKDKDIIILAVKPHRIVSVIDEIKDSIREDQIIISVAASVTCVYIEERLANKVPVIRAMPNIPSFFNAGMTVLSKGTHAHDEHITKAEKVFTSVGKTIVLEESLLDAATGLSASGPAYLYVVIEALAEAGVKLGIPRETSTFLVAQTMLGTAKMALESNEHPALLKDMVTTPAGCTIDGLMELEEGKIRVTLIKAVVRAAERAKDLILQ